MPDIFEPSELILNKNNTVYHLHLAPQDIADTIITVGDPKRVAAVSKYFDKIELKKSNREFVTHTGWVGKKRITVISTGIGPDNIDIVLNELDALVNIDFTTRKERKSKKSLNIIRVGTSGGLQKELGVDSVVGSAAAIGLDAMAMFYKLKLSAIEKKNRTLFKNQFSIDNYVTEGSLTLFSQFAKMCIVGTTVTCPGFYAPQGRKLRYELQYPNLVDELPKFKTHKIPCITNFEMETSAIYFLGKLLGHNCLSLSLIVANRITKQFSNNYPKKMDELIKNTVEKLS